MEEEARVLDVGDDATYGTSRSISQENQELVNTYCQMMGHSAQISKVFPNDSPALQHSLSRAILPVLIHCFLEKVLLMLSTSSIR